MEDSGRKKTDCRWLTTTCRVSTRPAPACLTTEVALSENQNVDRCQDQEQNLLTDSHWFKHFLFGHQNFIIIVFLQQPLTFGLRGGRYLLRFHRWGSVPQNGGCCIRWWHQNGVCYILFLCFYVVNKYVLSTVSCGKYHNSVQTVQISKCSLVKIEVPHCFLCFLCFLLSL